MTIDEALEKVEYIKDNKDIFNLYDDEAHALEVVIDYVKGYLKEFDKGVTTDVGKDLQDRE